jgi:hypothetical protein
MRLGFSARAQGLDEDCGVANFIHSGKNLIHQIKRINPTGPKIAGKTAGCRHAHQTPLIA